MDQTHVIYAAIAVAIVMAVTVAFAFRAPAQFEQFVRRITLWYNLLVIAVATCLAAGAIYFAANLPFAPKHDMFFWVYMTGACLFGFFAFLNFATRHKGPADLGTRIVGLLRETAVLWRERFGAPGKAWKDAGRN
jgi:hypothetical protein